MRVKKVFVNDRRTRKMKEKGKRKREKRKEKREKEAPYVRLRAVKSGPVIFFVPISTVDETKSPDRFDLIVAVHTVRLFRCASCTVLHISDSLQQRVLLILKIEDCPLCDDRFWDENIWCLKPAGRLLSR
jgi:hypothetical protein